MPYLCTYLFTFSCLRVRLNPDAFSFKFLLIFFYGASKNLNPMEWDKLWTINKKMIDPVCSRHTAVYTQHRLMMMLVNEPAKPYVRIIPKNKKFEGAGTKATTYTNRIWLDQSDAKLLSVGEEVTHMAGLVGVLHPKGSVKTTILKVTWLPDTDELVDISWIQPSNLIVKKKVNLKLRFHGYNQLVDCIKFMFLYVRAPYLRKVSK